MAKKRFTKPRITKRREKLATIVQFTSTCGLPNGDNAVGDYSDRCPDQPQRSPKPRRMGGGRRSDNDGS